MSDSLDRPEIKQALTDALKEYAKTRTEIESLKSHMKEIVGAASDVSGIEKKQINKIAQLFYKQNLVEHENEFSEIRELYQKIVGNTTP